MWAFEFIGGILFSPSSRYDFGPVRNSFYKALNITDPGHASQATLMKGSQEVLHELD